MFLVNLFLYDSRLRTKQMMLITSAAVVAREMKKPCIVDTKFATQVIKDGDELEVNADSGMVRILRKWGN